MLTFSVVWDYAKLTLLTKPNCCQVKQSIDLFTLLFLYKYRYVLSTLVWIGLLYVLHKVFNDNGTQ